MHVLIKWLIFIAFIVFLGHYPVVWIAIQINIRLNFGCCLRRKHRLTGTTFLRNNINMCSKHKICICWRAIWNWLNYTRDRAFNKFCLSGEVSLIKCSLWWICCRKISSYIDVWSQCFKIMIVSRPIQTTGVLRRRIGSTYKCVSVFFWQMHVQKVWYDVYSVNIYHSLIY